MYHLIWWTILTTVILCPSWEEPFIKKGVLCIECKVRYFLSYYMQLALKYILILFIICSCGCHHEHTTFSLMFMKMPNGKRLRSQRKEVVANVYDYFEELNRHKQAKGSLKWTSDPIGLSCTSIKRLIILMMNSSRHFQSSFFVKSFFQSLYRCLKLQKDNTWLLFIIEHLFI